MSKFHVSPSGSGVPVCACKAATFSTYLFPCKLWNFLVFHLVRYTNGVHWLHTRSFIPYWKLGPLGPIAALILRLIRERAELNWRAWIIKIKKWMVVVGGKGWGLRFFSWERRRGLMVTFFSHGRSLVYKKCGLCAHFTFACCSVSFAFICRLIFPTHHFFHYICTT